MPNHAGTCQRFEMQRQGSDGWRTVSVADCVPLDETSRAAATYTASRIKGPNDRMRSVFTGSERNVATAGAWRYLRFTS